MADGSLSPPGSSVYSSDRMYVGDGTWDSQRNTFLLPNLQGLNFETMQYNGMGNRFRNMTGYRALIMGHGILAAITFLAVVPGAILIARFYHRNPRMALRMHIWLQIMTVLLSTALFILGFQAVGPERSLTNPHHGIGVALYTLVMAQAFAGCLIHRTEKGKERFKVPLKLMLHQWIGRATALLGIIQVALGLTLYGSPKVLFILFAIWCFALLIAYFVLSFKNQPEMGFDDGTTYITERTESSRGHGRHGVGKLAAAGAAGAGLAALASRRRSRSRSRSRSRGPRNTVLSSRRDSRISESAFTDEKYTDVGKRPKTWKEKLFGAAALGGGAIALGSLFNRNKRHAVTETGSEVSYSRPIGPSEITQTDLSRVEEGRAPGSPGNDRWRRVEEREAAEAAVMAGSPLRRGQRSRRSGTSISSFDSRTSFDESQVTRKNDSHGIGKGIAALGLIGFLKHRWNKRKNQDEEEHVEALRRQDLEAERVARANSQRRRFTGDGYEPPRRAHPPSTILSESDISGTTPGISRPNIPPPPRNVPGGPGLVSGNSGPAAGPPVLLPPPGGVFSDNGSEEYTSPSGGQHRRHRTGTFGTGQDSAALGVPPRDHSRHRGSADGSGVTSPPVSVKVKMHNDGRHVTLRRLNEEEAAAEREARRRDRQQRRERNGSVSSLSNFDNDRWRRVEALEAQQAREAQATQAGQPGPPPPPGPPGPISMPEPMIPQSLPGPPPGPPPVPMHQSPAPFSPPPTMPAAGASILSSPPGTQIFSETDVSNYDSNRRRRRAERAQAKQARQSGSRVEFS